MARAQAVWGVVPLMRALAVTRSATARFTERETAPVLSAPLISTGTLTWRAPDYLRKTTISPAPQNFALEHNQVTITSAAGSHVFSLDQDPRIAGLVVGIRATLAGDLPDLQHYYTLSLTGSAAAWQLRLVPREQALARFIRVITISGTQGHIGVIDTQSADGGETRMSIAADAP